MFYVQRTMHGIVARFPLAKVRGTDREMSRNESLLIQNGYVCFYDEPSISRYVCPEHNTGSVDGNYPASCGIVELVKE